MYSCTVQPIVWKGVGTVVPRNDEVQSPDRLDLAPERQALK